MAPDKMPSEDEYGFAISRTLAMAIKADWLALEALGVSSKAAPKRAEIRDRQAQRDEFLCCPPGYSPERDMTRRDELVKKRCSAAEETELARSIARITASEAAFNRSPEGQIYRRLEDIEYRRQTANKERNRLVGLTRAEGKELDELGEKYPGKFRSSAVFLKTFKAGSLAPTAGDDGWLRAAAHPDESEMEELLPTLEELLGRESERKAELIKLRRASGDPDPWGGEAPLRRIYELEARRYLAELEGDLTPAESAELRQIARLYPEDVAKLRKMVERRLYRRQ
jgi:hypothetical protein